MNSKRKSLQFILLNILFFTQLVSAQSNTFKVALDAGHGGKDFGASYHGYLEKRIALEVVLRVGKILEKQPDIDVVYTRKTDVFIELIERANIANRADANIFVSIHCNANANLSADGTETYVMGVGKNASNLEAAKRENAVITMEKDYKIKYEGFDPNSPEKMIGMTMLQEEYMDNSIALASKIQNNFTDKLGRKSRGVKQALFMVLHKAYMPRVLIEMGFISNPKEGAYLNSEEGQNELAEAIAKAIISYKKEYFGGEGQVTEKPSEKLAPEDRVAPSKPAMETQREPEPQQQNAVVESGIIFKVQISASGKKLEPTPANFKGLSDISVSTDNGTLYKYMYGSTSDYAKAKELLATAKAKGYDSAYIIAFKDGKKISVQEAIKQ